MNEQIPEAIERKILRILDRENRSLSIRELNAELEKMGVKKSPQVITKYLKILVKTGKLEEI
jgi:hypothetical protein